MLENLLSEAVGQSVRLTGATALGDSSLATPWRIDAETGGEHVGYLLRYGDSVSQEEAVALQAMADHPIPTPRGLALG